MKITPSIPLTAAAVALPSAAALHGAGLISGSVFAILAVVCAAAVLILCIHPSFFRKTAPEIQPLCNGCILVKTIGLCVVFHIAAFILLKTILKIKLLPSLCFLLWCYALIILLIVFAGVRLVLKSRQLTLAQRILLFTVFWIPVVDLFVIRSAGKTAYREFDFEESRIELDNARAENEICRTKYPILLVHGIFFRDSNFFNYWGRIPAALIKNGAQIYYGNQHSAASVEECAKELSEKISEITKLTGCGKVNVIAHSKGGLDIRCAADLPGISDQIASITTINTPHKGCRYAEVLLNRIPKAILHFIADNYDRTLDRFGDNGSDFIRGVTDLTASRCARFNDEHPIPEGVYCRSFGSYMKKPTSAGFPLNFAYLIVKLFSTSPNDGLVDVESMRWGDSFMLFEPKTKRGISHGDMIDLFRENISKFDVREAYVDIVADLKNKGY